MFPVTPVPSSTTRADPAPARGAPAPELRIGQGRFFSYALPDGWRVGEDGQFALTLIAPDSHALTIMVGNSGVPLQYPPGQFVYEKLLALQPQQLQLGPGRQAPPIAGFQNAVEFDVTYLVQGVPCRGVAQCHIAPAYDSCVMAVTAALAHASQWPGYTNWLPLVARQIAATDGAAFGMRGIMQQNLKNSTAYAEAARQYREWSRRNWQETVDQRAHSEDRRSFSVRENLGNSLTFANPYDDRPVELPNTYGYYWVNRQGEILGTDDASANPNAGSSGEWTQMPRYRP